MDTVNTQDKPDQQATAHPASEAKAGDNRTEHIYKIWDRILATFTALCLVIGGGWTVYQQFNQRAQEARQRHREYLLLLHKEKKELYQPLCSAASKIATARILREAQPSIDRFWELYFGEVHLVKDETVQQAKNDFGDALLACQDQMEKAAPGELRNLAQAIALACQRSLALEKVYGEGDPARTNELASE